MHLKPRLAPYTFAVLPLSNKLVENARNEVFNKLHCDYDCVLIPQDR